MMSQAAISFLLRNTTLKDDFILGDLDDRDALIRDLVCVLGVKCPEVADYFDLSDRHVRRIAAPSRFRLVSSTPDSTSSLTPKEIETMARDYASDPYITAEEREAAFLYLKSGCPLVPL